MRAHFRDRFNLLALAFVAIPLVVYAWPGVRAGSSVALWAAHVADPLFLIFTIVTLVASRRPTPHAEERRFWALILATCGLWFAGNVLPYAVMMLGGPIPPHLIRDPLFLASFVTLVLSADFQPHRPAGWSRATPAFGFAVAATILCLAGMLLSFFVIPLLRRTGANLDATASLTFVALDVVMTVRFAYLLFVASGSPWAPVYGWLALSTLAATAADGLTLLETTGRLHSDYGTPLDAVWWLPFVGLVAARRVRTRHVDSGLSSAPPVHELPQTDATGQIFLYALSFPATLLALDAVGLQSSSEPGTRVTVLIALLAFVALAVVQQHVLERRNRDLRSKLSVLVTHEQLVQSQKLEAIGRLAGGLAHDFNNLLTVVMSSADLLAGSLPAGAGRRDAERIRSAAERGAALTRQLLAFSRSQVMRTRAMDLNATVREAEPILARLIGERHALAIDAAPALRGVEAEPGQVFQVLLNLVANARDAMPDGGTITIRTHADDLARNDPEVVPPTAGGSFVALEVRDDGVGIDAAMRHRMFEPFSTNKVGGTGLGLAVVYGIVSQGGGHVRVRSEPGRGTSFAVLFPCSTRPVGVEAPAAPHPATVAGSRRSVLLVEDQDHVRGAVQNLLHALDYHVLAVSNGTDALAALRDARPAPDLLLTDVVMPGMRGTEVASRARAICPEIRVVFMSGFLDGPLAGPEADAMEAVFIAKPFTLKSLGSALEDALRGAPGAP